MFNSSTTKRRWFICTLVCGFLLLATGLTVHYVLPILIHNQVEEKIPLYVGSLTYSGWLDPPADIYMQYWVFDVKNSDEIVNKGLKPVVEQRGPYTYRETRHKVNVTFHNNGTVSYRQIRRFTFVENMSYGSDNENFTTLNLPLIVVANKVKTWPKFVDQFIAFALEYLDGNLFIQKSVYDMIWGYDDPALAKLSAFAAKFGVHIDPKVGLFYGKNDSDDGLYTVYTGKQQIIDFVRISRWNGLDELHYWSTPSANDVNGTDGTMFHPFVEKTDQLYIYSSDICRSIYGQFVEETSVLGLTTYLFVPPAAVFAKKEENPANAGFCIPNCLGSGVLNMSTCQPGIPAIVSQPHFYQAEPRYIQGVDGMHPSKECRTELDIEPTTGLVLRAGKKLQISMAIEPVAGFTVLDKIKPVFLPMTWLNESALIDLETANQLKDQIQTPVIIATWSAYGAMILGCFLLVVGAAIIFTMAGSRTRRGTQSQPLVVNAHSSGLQPSSDGTTRDYQSIPGDTA